MLEKNGKLASSLHSGVGGLMCHRLAVELAAVAGRMTAFEVLAWRPFYRSRQLARAELPGFLQTIDQGSPILVHLGGDYGPEIEWSETVGPPKTAKQFAREAIYVICNSGMRNRVARPIYERCMHALRAGGPARAVFGHAGKAAAIDTIWADRKRLFAEYRAAADPVAYCATLPWIGPITKYHLAKNFGGDWAKPDVHLLRLANAEGCTPQELCVRLSEETGYRAAAIDLILWHACADGIINSRRVEAGTWLEDSAPTAEQLSKSANEATSA